MKGMDHFVVQFRYRKVRINSLGGHNVASLALHKSIFIHFSLNFFGQQIIDYAWRNSENLHLMCASELQKDVCFLKVERSVFELVTD